MRIRLFITLLLCLPLSISATDAGDDGYDDIDGFFALCSKVKSPGLRYTYISKLMMERVSSLPATGNFDLKPISEKVDFVQSIYIIPSFESVGECVLKAEKLPQSASENGFERVMSFNKDGSHTNILLKSGEGGLNSLLMTNVCYNAEGKIESVVVALIGGVFSFDEILSLMKL